MPSTSSLATNPVLISSLARILEIAENEFAQRCKVSVTGIGGASGFSSVYKVGVVDENNDGGREEWIWFMKVVDGEGMVRGEFYSLKAIHLSVPHLCPLPYCYGSLSPVSSSSHPTFYDDTPSVPSLPPPSPSIEPLDLDPTTSKTEHFLLTDYISPLPSSPPTTLHPHQRLSYKLALLHSHPAPSNGVPGFPVTTMCGSTPQPNHPLPGGDASWAKFFMERRLKAIGERCPKGAGAQGRDLSGLVERVGREVVHRLFGEEEGLVVCHGDLWSGNYTKGRIERVWGRRKGSGCASGSGHGEGENEGHGEGNAAAGVRKGNVYRESITGEFIFDPAAVYGPPTYDHGIMHMFGGFGEPFWSDYWRFRKELYLARAASLSLSSSSETPLPWDIKTQPTASDRRIKLYELYHYLNHYALFGWSYGLGAEKLMKGLLGVAAKEAWVGEV